MELKKYRNKTNMRITKYRYENLRPDLKHRTPSQCYNLTQQIPYPDWKEPKEMANSLLWIFLITNNYA